jgi:hypothetical protein
LGFDFSLSLRKTAFANYALQAVAGMSGAMFPCIIDNLQMQSVPPFLWKQTLEIFFSLNDALSIAQLPSLGESVNVSVHRKSRMPKSL